MPPKPSLYPFRATLFVPLAAAALASPLAAQIVPTGTPAADIVLAQGIADWRVFVTCSSLDPPTNWYVVDELYRDIDAASAILKAKDVPPQTVDAFAAAASPDALSPAPDTHYVDVLEFCEAHADWNERWLDRRFTFLERDLEKAFP